MMGDSAGGGYALALAQAVAAEGGHPDVVLISPYADATASDPDLRRFAHRPLARHRGIAGSRPRLGLPGRPSTLGDQPALRRVRRTRDLVGWQFPYMLQPKATWAFLGILAGAALIYGTQLRPGAIFDRPSGG